MTKKIEQDPWNTPEATTAPEAVVEVKNDEFDALDKLFVNAKPDDGFTKIPDGDYVTIISKGELKISKNSGKKMFVIEAVIQEGEFKKSREWQYFVLEGEHVNQNMGKLKKLTQETLRIPNITGFDSIIKYIENETVMVNMKIKTGAPKPNGDEGYRNVSFSLLDK